MSANRIPWYTALGCDESDDECLSMWRTIHIAAIIPSVLSIISSIFIIITGIKYHKTLSNLSLAAQLPIYISIADLLFEIFHGGDHLHSVSTGYLLDGAACSIFGSMKIFGINIQTAWAMGVSIYLIRTIFNQSMKEIKFGPKNIYLHICCWGGPMIILIFGYAFNVYGNSLAPWCDAKEPGIHFLISDLWMIIVVIALTVNYGLIIFKLRAVIQMSHTKSRSNVMNYSKSHNRYKKVMKTVGFYPIAFIAQWLAYILYTTHMIPQTFVSSVIVVLFGNSGGVFNLFLYGPLLLNQIKRQKNKNKNKHIRSISTSTAAGVTSISSTGKSTTIEMESTMTCSAPLSSSCVSNANSQQITSDIKDGNNKAHSYQVVNVEDADNE